MQKKGEETEKRERIYKISIQAMEEANKRAEQGVCRREKRTRVTEWKR